MARWEGAHIYGSHLKSNRRERKREGVRERERERERETMVRHKRPVVDTETL